MSPFFSFSRIRSLIRVSARFLLLILAIWLPSTGHEITKFQSRTRERVVSYAGKWFQIAAIPHDLQQQCASDISVTYTQVSMGRVRVTSECGKSDGKLKTAVDFIPFRRKTSAAASRSDVTNLSFLPFVRGNFWVVDASDEYAVIGDTSRKKIWILSRSSAMNDDLYRTIIERAARAGFKAQEIKKNEITAPIGTSPVTSTSVATDSAVIAAGNNRYLVTVRPGHRARVRMTFGSNNENLVHIEDQATGQRLRTLGNWRKVGLSWIQDNSGGMWDSPENTSDVGKVYAITGVSKVTPPNDYGRWYPSPVRELSVNSSGTNIIIGFEDNGFCRPFGHCDWSEQDDFNDASANILLERLN